MTSRVNQTMPGYAIGTWDIDPVHSEVAFTVRHLMVSKVRGRFTRFQGTLETRENVAASEVAVTIDATSIETGHPQRDDHVRSADFFDVEHHPTWSPSVERPAPRRRGIRARRRPYDQGHHAPRVAAA